MPVRYSDDSSGPSTRAAADYEQPESGVKVAATWSSAMTRAELADLARERGLSTSGSKAQLLERLSGIDVS